MTYVYVYIYIETHVSTIDNKYLLPKFVKYYFIYLYLMTLKNCF